ncbi:MAG TPA: hypothetical protein VH591_20755 [Ktedonobacterales bacterium]
MSTVLPEARQALRTPRAAAVAGIIFSVLLTVSLLIIRLSIIAKSRDLSAWLSDSFHQNIVAFALNLVPFAGIAFLWFIGVVRDHLGDREDRLFATVFLGSGLLFVAMLFATAAVGGVLTANFADAVPGSAGNAVWEFELQVTSSFLTIYAMRMAGVFMITTATLALRTGFLPRWFVFFGYVCALILLLTINFAPWIEFLLPLWVFMVSLHILRVNWGQQPQPTPTTPTTPTTKQSTEAHA